MEPWDQRLARAMVAPLAPSALKPNHLTWLSLGLALAGAGLLAQGSATSVNWGAGLFVVARFADHFDGELARAQGSESRFGYYFDYVTGAISYAALFLGMGFGPGMVAYGELGAALGVVGALASFVSLAANMRIDSIGSSAQPVGYPGFAGFELEDGIYLLAPVTWLGLLAPFFLLAGIGAVVYVSWTLLRLLRMTTAKLPAQQDRGERGADGGCD